MLHQMHYVLLYLSRLLSHVLSVLCQTLFFRFARTLNGFRWNSREAITTKNRLNDYILRELEQEKEAGYDSEFKSTSIGYLRCQRDADAYEFKIHCTDDGRCDLGHNFTYKFDINMSGILPHFFIHMIIIQQHRSTADIDTYIRPFIRSLRLVCLFAMATSIRKTLQRLSDKCSGGGIIWPQAVFSSLVLLCYISLLLDELLCSVYTCTAFNTTLSKRSDSVPFSNSVISILVRYVLRPHAHKIEWY